MDNPTLKNLTASNFGVPPPHQNELLQILGEPHVRSFNYMLEEGLAMAVKDINPVEFMIGERKIRLTISNYTIASPCLPFGTICVKDTNIYPSECRQRAATYKGKLLVDVDWYIDDIQQQSFQKDLGDIPIMLKSNCCHLSGLSPKQLVKRGEHEQEWGGYFVIKGHEKLIRMLLMTRRNYPVAIKRNGWKQRGALFSEYGVSIRCVKDDQTATNNVLHYATDGSAKLMFSYQKTLYYAPLCLILKCLCNYSDRHIYLRLIQGCEDDLYYVDCVQRMLRELHVENLHRTEECRTYLGRMFRVKFYECPSWCSDAEVTDFILKRCLLIHLDSFEDKFSALVFMTQKLFAFAQDKCKVEGADSVMMQELLLGGHLYLQIVKEKLQSWLFTLRTNLLKMNRVGGESSVNQNDMLKAAKSTGGIDHSLELFLATGSINSISGLGLMQDKGLVIMAENINRMRYMSHFRAVHRGAFFQEMRTTEVRQLLPDAWGFICPVHTPDGSPCGLLNHLAMDCTITQHPDPLKVKNIPIVLTEFGMVPLKYGEIVDVKDSYTVHLDGRIIGFIMKKDAGRIADKLRLLKIQGDKVPATLEIVVVPMKNTVCQYPGVFLFTGPARMMRPLLNLYTKKVELVGTFEQVYMNICVTGEEAYKGVTTHMELSKISFLSNLAQLIPMPDCNQSPRNMYQCQMGKQTMGTPCHNWELQAETKLYRLQTPASPLFRPVHHDQILLDDFAMGTNAIVAVISYTGYDMEDAMIINKASEERGLAHGSIYKSEFIELDHVSSYFARNPAEDRLSRYLENDGLPFVGRVMREGEPHYCFYDYDRSQYIVKSFKGKEECYINSVRLCENIGARNACKIACITYRVPRNPSVGDKFASRAGQKGICSQKWPAEDLPFTETGLVPDIVFNPHGFPSRMTIAMMIELMAGKSAACHGLVHDATPFRFTEEETAIDYFGKLLVEAGYDYYGNETMYSGVDGREMGAQVFFGVVHYQRLRHMVSDKWQVRSTGPINILTRQPLQGRKRGGGVRFGEMERDALISHGAAFLLQDRLFHCSDKTDITKNKAFYSTLRALRMLCLYPKRNKGVYFYLHMMRMAVEKGLVFMLVIGVCILHVVSAWETEQIDISEDVAIICGGLGATMTNILFGCKIRNWSKFFLKINDFRRFGTPTTYKDTINRLNFYSTSYFCYCTIGMGVYASVAVYESKECRAINEQYGLHDICWSVTPTWLPLKHVPGYLKVIFFTMQFIGCFHIVASAALICFLTWEATEVLLTHVSHLKRHLLEVFDDVNNATERLGILVEYHKYIYSVADQLNRLVQATVGHVSLVAALVFGCIGNQVFKSKPLGACVFLTGWVIAMFMICHAGQKIRDESLSIADTIYFADWYRGTVQQKKDIAFMIFRSQKPIFFDALPFGTLNYPLFVMIIKTSYSYLTLLKQST